MQSVALPCVCVCVALSLHRREVLPHRGLRHVHVRRCRWAAGQDEQEHAGVRSHGCGVRRDQVLRRAVQQRRVHVRGWHEEGRGGAARCAADLPRTARMWHARDFVKCDTCTCGAGFVDKPTKNNEACGAAVADCTDAKRCDPQAKCDTFTCARPGSPTRWARLRSCAGLRRPTATTGCAATLRAAGRELHVRPLSLLTLSHSPPPSPTQAPRRPHRPSSIPTLHPPATIQDGRGHDRVRRRVTCCDASCTEEPFACTAPAMILGKVATVRCGGSRKACCEPHRCRLRDDCLPAEADPRDDRVPTGTCHGARRAPATV